MGRKQQQKEHNREGLSAAAECLKVLGHPTRLRFLQLLNQGEFSVAELAEDSEVPQNVASEHLRLMQRCGFLSQKRVGRQVFYSIAEPHLRTILKCVEDRFIDEIY